MRLLTRVLISILMMALFIPAVAEEKTAKAGDRRAKIDAMAEETLATLFSESPKAKELYGKAHGYAVFDNLKLSLFISGGGGVGVATTKGGGSRTYMKMGTAGLNIGLGGQKYQLVFLFQTRDGFDRFVDKGWQADAQANAVAGTAGANAAAAFKNGMAVFQITEAGLMLQADIAGTKYWKSKKLNN